jgi:hypothetical protein
MKTKIILLFIFCCIALSANAQDYTVVRTTLKDLKTQYEAKIIIYKSEKAKLEDPKNIADTAFDTNAQKVTVANLYNELVSICNQQNSLKLAFKGKVPDSDMESDFPDALAKDFKEKIRPVTTSFANDNLTYLNAYNFDFNNSSASSGYMGNLNLFFAINRKSGESKWAINAGLKKINYAFADSKYTTFAKENILIRPLDNVEAVGDKYYREFNQYTTTSKISSWSGYFQLLRRIAKDKIDHLYLHTHIELQISKVDFNTEKLNIQRDTATVAAIEDIPVLQTGLENNFSITNTFFGYYVGVGITGDFNIIKQDNYNLRYFVQETLGYSNLQLGNSKALLTQNEYFNNNVNFMGNFSSDRHLFHLLNTYVSNKINGLNIMIGAEIRGVFDSPPLYIFYVGINTDLQKIGGLFK